jgi:hypothetical protein
MTDNKERKEAGFLDWTIVITLGILVLLGIANAARLISKLF